MHLLPAIYLIVLSYGQSNYFRHSATIESLISRARSESKCGLIWKAPETLFGVSWTREPLPSGDAYQRAWNLLSTKFAKDGEHMEHYVNELARDVLTDRSKSSMKIFMFASASWLQYDHLRNVGFRWWAPTQDPELCAIRWLMATRHVPSLAYTRMQFLLEAHEYNSTFIPLGERLCSKLPNDLDCHLALYGLTIASNDKKTILDSFDRSSHLATRYPLSLPCLGLAAFSCIRAYGVTKDVSYLHRAISIDERYVELAPAGSPGRENIQGLIDSVRQQIKELK